MTFVGDNKMGKTTFVEKRVIRLLFMVLFNKNNIMQQIMGGQLSLLVPSHSKDKSLYAASVQKYAK